MPLFSVPEPAVVLVLRGINAFKRVDAIISARPSTVSSQLSGTDRSCLPLDRLLSPTAELAFRQATLFFQDKELMADEQARTLRGYLPPNTRLLPGGDR